MGMGLCYGGWWLSKKMSVLGNGDSRDHGQKKKKKKNASK